jgi:hypothetical protein
MPKISITPDLITHVGNSIALDNPILRNMLVQNPAAAQHWLATKVAPVDPAAISIDSQGRVVIADAKFASIIAERLRGRGLAEMGDTACSNGSCGALMDSGILASLEATTAERR